MATRRNALGEALEKLSDNMLQVAMHQQQMGMEQQRIDLSAQGMAQDARRDAFQRVLSFAPFIKPDSKIADNPFIHDSVREAFGEQAGDPADPNGIGGIVFNEQSFEQIIKPMLIEQLAGMSEGDRKAIMARTLNRTLLGTPSSQEEIEMQDNIVSIKLDALNNLRSDPNMLNTIARTTLGMEPITRVQYGGQTYEWDTTAAANISVRLLEMQDRWSFAREFSTGEKADLAGELMKQVQDNGIAAISRPLAMQIINAVHAKDPNVAVAQLRMAGLSPEAEAALTFYIQGAAIADGIPDWIAETDPEMAKFMELANWLSSDEGMGLGAEAADAMLPEISKRLFRQGAPLPRPAGWFELWNQSGIKGRPQTRTPAVGQGGGIEESNAATRAADRATQMGADADALNAKTITTAELRSKGYTPQEILVIVNEAAYRRNQ